MGVDLAVLLFARSTSLVLTIVGLLTLGMALITPNLTALISKGQKQQTGAALGLRNAANSLGQAAGFAVGGLLFALDVTAAYAITGALLVGMPPLTESSIAEPFGPGGEYVRSLVEHTSSSAHRT